MRGIKRDLCSDLSKEPLWCTWQQPFCTHKRPLGSTSGIAFWDSAFSCCLGRCSLPIKTPKSWCSFFPSVSHNWHVVSCLELATFPRFCSKLECPWWCFFFFLTILRKRSAYFEHSRCYSECKWNGKDEALVCEATDSESPLETAGPVGFLLWSSADIAVAVFPVPMVASCSHQKLPHHQETFSAKMWITPVYCCFCTNSRSIPSPSYII